MNRKRNGITDPVSGMQNQPRAANVLPLRLVVSPHRPVPDVPHLWAPSATSRWDHTLSQRQLRCATSLFDRVPFRHVSDHERLLHSVLELTPSSIAACESQVNNEMRRSDTPGTANIW